MAPLVSHLVNEGFIKPEAYNQTDIFKAGLLFAKAEGIIPAPEANHAVKGAIESALECKLKGEKKTILFNLCGHGYFDMQAYIDYFENKLLITNIDDESSNGPFGTSRSIGLYQMVHSEVFSTT